MDSLPVYIPDYTKWKHYFEKHMLGSKENSIRSDSKANYIIPSNYALTDKRKAGVNVTVQMTSESQSEVERADAKEKRVKAEKRKGGEKVVTTKKIRRTANIPSSIAKALKSTPVDGQDIFS